MLTTLAAAFRVLTASLPLPCDSFAPTCAPEPGRIFRRADKNDDGKLSFEEFKNYFSDGILSSEELWELFSGIDRRHSECSNPGRPAGSPGAESIWRAATGFTAAPERERASPANAILLGWKMYSRNSQPVEQAVCLQERVVVWGQGTDCAKTQTLPLLTQGTAFHLCKSSFPPQVGPVRVLGNLGQLLVKKRKPQRAGAGIGFSSGLLMSGAIQRSLLGLAGILIPAFWVFLASPGSLCPAGRCGNVDTEKLCDYFSAYLGEYRNVLSALETLNAAVLAAMDKTKLRYETSSKMEQFLTRFLLRETMHQLQSLQASLECAVVTVEEQAGRERKEIKKSETSVGLRSGRRCGRRGQKNVCLSPTDPYSGMLTTGVCVEDNSQWMAQINRLQQLIEKLECKSPRLEPLKEEAMSKGQDAHILVAKRQISVATGSIEEFRQAFRSYTEGTAGHSSCLHVSACKLTDEACFILYEFWQDVTSWRSHLQSSCSKNFQQSILSLLESPELLTTMLFPASWWIMNNN
uniref:N-terminal EF-hand calcium binding protein 3 n=1 Tax=Cyanoderma ruficeps TaxID=181631 RepID=A0A8C3RD98_9PASS